MQKILISIAIILTSTINFSQDRSKEILEIISNETSSYSSMNIDFKLTIKSIDFNETQIGTAVTEGNNFYYKTQDREVISNSTDVWTYIVDDNECYIDALEDLDGGINPSEIMTIWEDNFKFKYLEQLEADSDGDNIHRIKLFPSNPKDSKYHTIILKINETKKQIISATIKTKDGMTLYFIISKLSPNKEIKPNTFVWNNSSHPGVELIDNR